MELNTSTGKPAAPAIHSSKSSLRINKLGDTIGAEAVGVDLTQPIDADTKQRLNDAVIEHIALVVRDQHFTPYQFQEASRVFGNPIERPNKSHSLGELPIVHEVSSRQVDTEGTPKKTGEDWHTDHTNLEIITKYTILYPKELPASGGGTSVCNTREGYRALPEELRRQIDGMKTANVIHGSATRPKGRGVADQIAEQKRKNPTPVIHPLVETHPVTGSKAVNFNLTKMEHILGMNPEDSQDFLEYLTLQLAKPEFVYTHYYRMGDMFLWDNRSSMHRANFDFTGDRTLLRIVIAGDGASSTGDAGY